jgi:hypothetical protein
VFLIVVQDLDEEDRGIIADWHSTRLRGYCCARDQVPAFIPRGSDMIRSWGIHQAWLHEADYTLSLDDDVLPAGDLFAAYERVFEAGAPLTGHLDVGALTTAGVPMRGYPYTGRRSEVAVQYGGWHGVLDYDARTQLAGVHADETFHPVTISVPRGAAVTGCAMNMAWKTRYAPLMWQLPLHDGRYNRFGDIWAGLLTKRVCDSLGLTVVVNGHASVHHNRASDPHANLVKEQPGLPLNEGLWGALLTPATVLTPEAAYRKVTDTAHHYFRNIDPDYADHFRRSRDQWLALYE